MTDFNSFQANINSSIAATAAAQAAVSARHAQNAAEERLEGNTRFVVLPVTNFERVYENTGFWSRLFEVPKKRLLPTYQKFGFKVSDISYLDGTIDDFGNRCTTVYLEDRCDYDYTSVIVALSIEELTQLLNQ